MSEYICPKCDRRYSISECPDCHDFPMLRLLDRITSLEKVVEPLMAETIMLCNLICNSPQETMIKGEIESKALSLGQLTAQYQNILANLDKENQ